VAGLLWRWRGFRAAGRVVADAHRWEDTCPASTRGQIQPHTSALIRGPLRQAPAGREKGSCSRLNRATATTGCSITLRLALGHHPAVSDHQHSSLSLVLLSRVPSRAGTPRGRKSLGDVLLQRAADSSWRRKAHRATTAQCNRQVPARPPAAAGLPEAGGICASARLIRPRCFQLQDTTLSAPLSPAGTPAKPHVGGLRSDLGKRASAAASGRIRRRATESMPPPLSKQRCAIEGVSARLRDAPSPPQQRSNLALAAPENPQQPQKPAAMLHKAIRIGKHPKGAAAAPTARKGPGSGGGLATRVTRRSVSTAASRNHQVP